LHDPPIKKKAPLRRFFRFQGTVFTVQGENLQQVRLNCPAIQADTLASPGGRGPGRAEAILHDPPIKKKAPLRRFFRFRVADFTARVRLNNYKTSHKFTSFLDRCEMEPAQGTGSDRKDAKADVHDTLGPRRPGAGRFPPLTLFPVR
ncbi:hypothetical protein, partial [Pantoea vagans]|uniref:hypothetical protein n=1 Tax=Pantoea vagans TaxID=470934 RepID=UPI00289C4F92